MSFLTILDIGKSTLFTSQTQLNVTSNNIANASTPGYCRQDVILETNTPVLSASGFVGQGVSIAAIKRQYNAQLQNQINQAQQEYGKSTTLSQNLSYVEQIFNESQDLGLASPLTDFFNAWQEVANNPSDLTARNSLLQKSAALVNSAQSMEQGITSTLNQMKTGIADAVTQINSLASKIVQLNSQIAQIEAGSTTNSANDLRDQRDEALEELNNLVETSSWEDKSNGYLTVNVGMRTLVNGDTTNTLSTNYDQNGDYTLQLDGQDITSRITKGELGGILTARQDIEGNLLDLRKLVAAITNTVNVQHVQGYGLDSSTNTNFFNPLQLSVQNFSAGATLAATITNYSQLTLDEYSVQFNGANYEIYNKGTGTLKTSGAYNAAGTTINLEGIRFVISGAVTDQDNFTVSPLTTAIGNFGTAITNPQKIAASGTASGVPGDNTNALAVAGLINSQVTALNSTTFSDYYQSLVGQIGNQNKAASDGLTFTNNFLTQLTNQRGSVSGVDMDEEATNLIKYQRSYEAAARLITTADNLLQDLLNMIGR